MEYIPINLKGTVYIKENLKHNGRTQQKLIYICLLRFGSSVEVKIHLIALNHYP